MASTGLYFLPHTSTEGSPLRDFLIHLTATYNVTPLPRWALEHHIFRETPNAASADHTSVKYLQVLTLSHEPGPSYIAITKTHNNTTTTTTSASLSSSQQQQQRALRVRGADASTTDGSSSIGVSGETAATIASIASGQATDEFVQFLATKLAPLWTMLKMARVANGLSYE
ncbi:hypothetical protein MMC31_007551, partial [Peltigera leucophlebia]|nr:hypothetical protein [Peltigera leucophlebia]